MGMLRSAFTFAAGILVGILVPWAMTTPAVTLAVFELTMTAMALIAIAGLWIYLRRRSGRIELDKLTADGARLRRRMVDGKIEKPLDQDEAEIADAFDAWYGRADRLIQKYARHLHARLVASTRDPVTYLGIPKYRSELGAAMDALLRLIVDARASL